MGRGIGWRNLWKHTFDESGDTLIGQRKNLVISVVDVHRFANGDVNDLVDNPFFFGESSILDDWSFDDTEKPARGSGKSCKGTAHAPTARQLTTVKTVARYQTNPAKLAQKRALS
jgi:hypothetical protein